VVLHQPLAAGPCTRNSRGSEKGVWTSRRGSGSLVPGTGARGTPPAGNRAPPRGVDVKPLLAAEAGRGPGTPERSPGPSRGLEGLWDPGPQDPGIRAPESRTLREGPRGLGRAPWPGAARPAGVVLHQPLAGGGVQDPENGKKPPKWGFTGKKANFGQNSQKWLFFDVFPEKCPVATGLKMAKLAKNGQNLQKGLKVRFWGGLGNSRGGGFTSTPRGGALYPEFAGV